MRWLLDQGLPRTAAHFLCENGINGLHVGDIGMASASDSEILVIAHEECRIVVTLDSDFHALLALSGSSRPSFIRIREEGLKAAALCKLIVQLWNQFSKSLTSGCVLTATLTEARVRLLPITS